VTSATTSAKPARNSARTCAIATAHGALGFRDRNPNAYARGGWNAPFRYTAFRPGLRIGQPYYSSRYVIADPWRYHLPRARPGQQWVRHYNDVILVDTRRGYVVDVNRGFYR
jgi:Ni/Co efflux regulator RcnB